MDGPRIIDSELYKRCPVCHFEERHLVSCVISRLEAHLQEAQAESRANFKQSKNEAAACRNAEAERDAAIERGVRIYGEIKKAQVLTWWWWRECKTAEQRAERAEVLAEARLSRGLWALDVIRATLDRGVTMTTAPAEALEQRGGDGA